MMNFVTILRSLLPLFKDSKTLIGIIACGALLGQWTIGYVDAKHNQGMSKITETQEQVEQIKRRSYRDRAMLRSIDRNLDKMNDRIKVIDQRIWEMYSTSKARRVAE